MISWDRLLSFVSSVKSKVIEQLDRVMKFAFNVNGIHSSIQIEMAPFTLKPLFSDQHLSVTITGSHLSTYIYIMARRAVSGEKKEKSMKPSQLVRDFSILSFVIMWLALLFLLFVKPSGNLHCTVGGTKLLRQDGGLLTPETTLHCSQSFISMSDVLAVNLSREKSLLWCLGVWHLSHPTPVSLHVLRMFVTCSRWVRRRCQVLTVFECWFLETVLRLCVSLTLRHLFQLMGISSQLSLAL